MKVNVLIVDSDQGRRMRLKDASRNESSFHRVVALRSLPEAEEKLSELESVGVVFLSHDLESEKVKGFMEYVRLGKGSEDAAFISVLPHEEQQRTSVAIQSMLGIDGFLCEPFSVDTVREIAEIALQVRKEKQEKRLRAAYTLILRDVVNHVDAIAMATSQGNSSALSQRLLRESLAPFASLEQADRDRYYEILIETFGEALPTIMPKKSRERSGRYRASWDERQGKGGVGFTVKKR
jgi:DNA-binding NtrC family response regulator